MYIVGVEGSIMIAPRIKNTDQLFLTSLFALFVFLLYTRLFNANFEYKFKFLNSIFKLQSAKLLHSVKTTHYYQFCHCYFEIHFLLQEPCITYII
jgi:nitrate reductase gamma subunit